MIGMRIGILTGPMVAGSMGSAQRLEYNVHGDTVNTAARIEGFDKAGFVPDHLKSPCRILIGQRTFDLIGKGFVTEPVGEARLKGKEQVIRIYRVLGRRDEGPGEEPAEGQTTGNTQEPASRVASSTPR
jgi:adenylate cyclase